MPFPERAVYKCLREEVGDRYNRNLTYGSSSTWAAHCNEERELLPCIRSLDIVSLVVVLKCSRPWLPMSLSRYLTFPQPLSTSYHTLGVRTVWTKVVQIEYISWWLLTPSRRHGRRWPCLCKIHVLAVMYPL